MQITTPTHPCKVCHRPNLVYNPDDVCVACVTASAHEWQGATGDDISERWRAGWRLTGTTQGYSCGWCKR